MPLEDNITAFFFNNTDIGKSNDKAIQYYFWYILQTSITVDLHITNCVIFNTEPWSQKGLLGIARVRELISSSTAPPSETHPRLKKNPIQ